MELFLQCTGLVLLGVLLTLIIGKQSSDMSILLSLGICCCVCIAAAGYLGAMTELLGELRSLGGLDHGFLAILLKCAGIGFLAELAGLICMDAGQNAMAKALQILANAAVIYLSIPMVRSLMDLLQEVLGQF